MSEKKISQVTFCALDLETTGTNPAIHKIVEVGIVRFTMDRIIDTYEMLVNPEMEMPENVISIHGITDEMVASAPVLDDIINDITEFISGSVLVIQNPGFDLSFFVKAYMERKMDISLLVAYDTVRLSRLSFPDFPNHKLGTLCSLLGIAEGGHRALSDAKACMEVFRKVILKNDPSGLWCISDLEKYHGGFTRPQFKRGRAGNKKMFLNIRPGKVVKIKYCDSKGNITIRDILPKELVKYGKRGYIYAYCYLRDNFRYFQTSRIMEVY